MLSQQRIMDHPKIYSLNFMGDVMLGRLIDQLLPNHVHEPSEAKIIQSFLKSNPTLKGYNTSSPWGSTLPILQSSDLNIINLETAVTTKSQKWPDKVFNYRMHPANIECLKLANIHYAGLANNHTLDFSRSGLQDTVRTVRDANIAYAGAGFSRDEALRPAVLKLTQSSGKGHHEVHIWAASDHPNDWSIVPDFDLISYAQATRNRLKSMISTPALPEASNGKAALKIFSCHWGPNYAWVPAKEIQDLAHFVIDECGIDIVHGHSSHHVQGVELYKGKLIIYGCGDFVDDYALVQDYRNDLSALWRVFVAERDGDLQMDRLEIFPTRIKQFQAQLMHESEADHEWIKDKITALSANFATNVERTLGDRGQLIVKL